MVSIQTFYIQFQGRLDVRLIISTIGSVKDRVSDVYPCLFWLTTDHHLFSLEEFPG